jgi:hypothetical protein
VSSAVAEPLPRRHAQIDDLLPRASKPFGQRRVVDRESSPQLRELPDRHLEGLRNRAHGCNAGDGKDPQHPRARPVPQVEQQGHALTERQPLDLVPQALDVPALLE